MSTSAPKALKDEVGGDVRAERSKRAGVVARQIEDDIAAAGWPVGSVFGTEPELTARYGASRSVLLEAVRLVEHHKVAAMRRGPKGGLVVREPDLHGAATALVIYLDHVGTTVADLMEARLALEPFAVRLATQQLTAEGASALRAAAHEELAADLTGADFRLPDRVHDTIAELSGNAVLRLFLDILTRLNLLFAELPTRAHRRRVAAATERLSREHRHLAEAVLSGNADVAEQRAIEHLGHMREMMLANARRRRGARVRYLPSDSGRYAEVLAERIRADLAREEARPGKVVGSEASLLERYDVSRQVLREAVRLLEHHGVATMRRGPGGGLVVTEPDPWASIQAITVYLDYQRMQATDLGAVWSAIESACLERVIARRDATVIARLRKAAAVEHHAEANADTVLTRNLHQELVALAGNPVLEAFFRIVSALWLRHAQLSPGSPLREHRQVRAVRRVHEEVVEAIAIGDGTAARDLLDRHFNEALGMWRRATK